jgi:hypothetical protein
MKPRHCTHRAVNIPKQAMQQPLKKWRMEAVRAALKLDLKQGHHICTATTPANILFACSRSI